MAEAGGQAEYLGKLAGVQALDGGSKLGAERGGIDGAEEAAIH